uniref:hypothetical protein n=1 Tax=Aspergillus sclerotioniger TaxID=319627 RepID=UPI0021146801|nr:hypothetical protein NQV51_mgp08 [Aspergillus sclerotioniger]USH57599.1 hypothetical protein [Aspergillus sclerotioniger]
MISKPQMYDFLFIFSLFVMFNYLYINPIKDFEFSLDNSLKKVCRLKGIYRIGPHNIDVISIIFGSLLGDGYAEKRLKGVGTRISFYQESSHVDYLLYLHKFFSQLGYCNDKIPVITTRLGVKGKVRKIIRFHTWSFTSFDWIHTEWYSNGIKIVPNNIGKYLTPLALAIWIMDDGSKVGNSLKLSTNSFSYNECLILTKALNNNFNIKATIQATGAKDQYVIYVLKQSMTNLRKIVSPYIIPSMKYKIL